MNLRTPLYDKHVTLGASWIDYHGWSMPEKYTSQLEEHHAVRQHVGIFDVSHMGIVEITGHDAKKVLRYALANDVIKLTEPGQAIYSCMLNEKGGILDDLIVYLLGENRYRIIWNCPAQEENFTWLTTLITTKGFAATIKRRTDMAIIAIQGPESKERVTALFPEWHKEIDALKPFKAFILESEDYVMASTGYTGEEGFEIMGKTRDIVALWQQFIDDGVTPCGLGARDTLRLEAGLNLCGKDMTQETTPLSSNLGWTVDWRDKKRDFVGREALIAEYHTPEATHFVGLVMDKAKGVLRDGQKVIFDDQEVGEITSGGYSPTLGYAIALARLSQNILNKTAHIERRGKLLPVRVVKPCFVRRGESIFGVCDS